MIFSLGSAEVTAEITSVRQFFTFSVMPSLSIMIICACVTEGKESPFSSAVLDERMRKGTYVCAGVDELLRAVDEPLGVARARGLELLDGGVPACAPSGDNARLTVSGRSVLG